MAIFGKKKADASELLRALVESMEAMSNDEYNDFIDKNADIFEELKEVAGDADDSADDKGKPDTEEEIAKAKEDIAEKGEDSQTEQDRIDESVAAQEEANGEEDDQDAKDRVDEAEGEEKADEAKSVIERIEAIEARLNALEGNEEGEDKEALEKAKAVYGVDGGTFAPDKNPKRATIEQAKKFAAKYL